MADSKLPLCASVNENVKQRTGYILERKKGKVTAIIKEVAGQLKSIKKYKSYAEKVGKSPLHQPWLSRGTADETISKT
jgi:hypothetical protein